MRKLLSIALCCITVLSLCACENTDDEIIFYYPRAAFEYGTSDGVIASEKRDATGHEDDLTYLLTLYLEGPLDPELTSPFPKGTDLLGLTYSDATLYVTLSEHFAGLDDMDHTVASACIAYTCFHLTEAKNVVIKCTSKEFGNKSITLSRDILLLTDNSAATSPSGTAP